MALVDLSRWRDAVDHDAEFRLAARFWSGRVRLGMGDRAILVRVADGRLVDVDAEPTPFDPFDFEIAAPEEDWREFLRPVPRPFFQDVFAASVHHRFRMGGDLDSLYAYYPATRRMLELMRDHVA